MNSSRSCPCPLVPVTYSAPFPSSRTLVRNYHAMQCERQKSLRENESEALPSMRAPFPGPSLQQSMAHGHHVSNKLRHAEAFLQHCISNQSPGLASSLTARLSGACNQPGTQCQQPCMQCSLLAGLGVIWFQPDSASSIFSTSLVQLTPHSRTNFFRHIFFKIGWL